MILSDFLYSLWLGSHDIRDTKRREPLWTEVSGPWRIPVTPITTCTHHSHPSCVTIGMAHVPPYTRSLPHSSRDTRCDCKEVSVDREWMWWGAPMDAFLSYHSAAGGPCERQTEWHTGWTTGGGMDHAPLTRHERREQWTRDAWRLNERKEWCMLSIWSHGSFLSSSYCRASLRVHVARPTRVSCLHAWPTEGEWKW